MGLKVLYLIFGKNFEKPCTFLEIYLTFHEMSVTCQNMH